MATMIQNAQMATATQKPHPTCLQIERPRNAAGARPSTAAAVA
jgi:hypothetical protein